MPDIKKLREMRFQFLNLLYEATGGSTRSRANMNELGEQLNFTSEETDLVTQYLVGESLMEYGTIGGGISITHYGVREVEEALTNPDEETEYFPPVNVINIHHMENSQISQGSSATSQTLMVGENELAELKTFLEEIKDKVEALRLDNEDMSEIQSDISTLETQTESSRPKPSIIRECLSSIRRILEGAAGGAAAQQLLPYIPPLLAHFS